MDQKRHAKRKDLDAVHFYEQNFGPSSPFVMESLLEWTNELGEELVIEAMKRALERNKTSWAYVKSILKTWQEKGVFTVEQAHAEQLAFENSRKQHSEKQKEVIPDWFYEQKRKREEQKRKAKKQHATMEDLKRVKEEFLKGRKVQQQII